MPYRLGKKLESVSLPTRGAWIEIEKAESEWRGMLCRSPHGERGLKLDALNQNYIRTLVAPHTGSVD